METRKGSVGRDGIVELQWEKRDSWRRDSTSEILLSNKKRGRSCKARSGYDPPSGWRSCTRSKLRLARILSEHTLKSTIRSLTMRNNFHFMRFIARRDYLSSDSGSFSWRIYSHRTMNTRLVNQNHMLGWFGRKTSITIITTCTSPVGASPNKS